METNGNNEEIFDLLPAMAWSATSDGLLDRANQHLLDYVGLTLEDIAGENFSRLFHPEDAEHLASEWSSIIASKLPKEVEGRIRRADGEFRWCALRQKPRLDAGANVLRWFGVISDIEVRKQAQYALKRTQTALAASQHNLCLVIDALPTLLWSPGPLGSTDFVHDDSLDSTGLPVESIARSLLHSHHLAHATLLTTIRELTVSVAHEINQPLMAIVTNAGTCLRWLQHGHTDIEQARSAAERIVNDGHRLGDIVVNIRAKATLAPSNKEKIDVNSVLREVMTVLEREIRARGLRFITDLSPDPCYVSGDTTQLQQIFVNLIMNSVEATFDEEGLIFLKCAPNEGNEIEITVSDTGSGILPEEANWVFEAFFTTKADRMGMGLAICRSLVEALGGRIWFKAHPPQGASFAVALPHFKATAIDW